MGELQDKEGALVMASGYLVFALQCDMGCKCPTSMKVAFEALASRGFFGALMQIQSKFEFTGECLQQLLPLWLHMRDTPGSGSPSGEVCASEEAPLRCVTAWIALLE